MPELDFLHSDFPLAEEETGDCLPSQHLQSYSHPEGGILSIGTKALDALATLCFVFSHFCVSALEQHSGVGRA